jgi:hypothetical protein
VTADGGGRKGSRLVMGQKSSGLGALMSRHQKRKLKNLF